MAGAKLSSLPPEHVAVDITPAATKKQAPSAGHVTVDIPAATTKKMYWSPLVRALVKGVTAASLLLGAPATFVVGVVTHRPFPFVLIGIFVFLFILGLHFQFREEDKDMQQAHEEQPKMGRK